MPIFSKIAVGQTVGGRGAAEGNSKPCKPYSPTQYNAGSVAKIGFLSRTV